MSGPTLAVDVAFGIFGLASVWFGWRVFRTDSMVRASFALLASFLNVGAILILLLAEYLGVALFFMMAVEMTVMALFMVAFMMNPAGLNPMRMVHQHALSIGLGVAGAAGVGTIAFAARFPTRPVEDVTGSIENLGVELLGESMLVFESVALALLATMLGAVVLSARSSRFGSAADEGSHPPPLDPGDPQSVPDVQANRDAGHDHHGPRGHGEEA